MRRHLLPRLAGAAPDAARSGSVACLGALVAQLGLQLVPFVNLVVVPLMRLTSDPLPGVRAAATSVFASAVALLPLAQVLLPPSPVSSLGFPLLHQTGPDRRTAARHHTTMVAGCWDGRTAAACAVSLCRAEAVRHGACRCVDRGVTCRQGMQPPAGLDEEQRGAWLHDAQFLAQLVDSSKARPPAQLVPLGLLVSAAWQPPRPSVAVLIIL